ncbi:hypothetical protein QUF61_08610 [Candidatus Venteria ishoeyi]|uniref:hypothetical protein n=1 Tax=Candidatus Venteria ishoeyi TaxID=1899563 RepID=UPI0025A52C4A|nr:hypothetical protein [Candidatus Venteria ishoeyi]MDM8546541.1 hypothetical protein [Candidatus Venteria ishoeyi]
MLLQAVPPLKQAVDYTCLLSIYGVIMNKFLTNTKSYNNIKKFISYLFLIMAIVYFLGLLLIAVAITGCLIFSLQFLSKICCSTGYRWHVLGGCLKIAKPVILPKSTHYLSMS